MTTTKIRLSENAPAHAGELMDFGDFLRAFGGNADAWPLDHCLCPGCGNAVTPRLFRQKAEKEGIDFAKAYELVSKKGLDTSLGYFEHTGPAPTYCPTALRTSEISARLPYIYELEFDFRVREQVRTMLEDSKTRELNNAILGGLLGDKDKPRVVDCFEQPHAGKLLSMPFLLGRPRAFPLMLAVLAPPFRRDLPNPRLGRCEVRYRTDGGKLNKGEYMNFDGQIVSGPVPKHIALHFTGSGQQITIVRPVRFPELKSMRPPAPRGCALG